MMLNKKVELGLKAVSALRTKTQPTRTQDLAVEIGTTVNFLEQIMRHLRIAGLVTSVRGPGGGYVVSDTSSETTAYSVALALGHNFGTLVLDSDPSNRLSKAIAEAFVSVRL